MTALLVRLFALVHKELLVVLADKESRRLLVVPLILQLALFPFAATLEVKNNVLAIYDEDGGALVTEIVERLSATPAFRRIDRLGSEAEVRQALDRQDALVVLRFRPGFSAAAARGAPEPVQALLDGRRSNSAQIAAGYVGDVLAAIPGSGRLEAAPSPLAVRHWYNPNLEYFRFIVPSLVAIITTISALVVTAMSVAREREQGTLDQLLVSPLTPTLVFVGKGAPAILVALFQGTVILAGGVFFYGITFQGSLPLLYASMIAYVAALVGVGLLISSFCATQQQAFLGVFLFVMPAVVLSGYVSPVENMPGWLQTLTLANPIRHFVFVVRAVYLKGAPWSDVAGADLAMLAIAACTSVVAHRVFVSRLA